MSTLAQNNKKTRKILVKQPAHSHDPAAELEVVMRELIDAYVVLERLARERHDAIRSADVAELGRTIEQESAQIQRVAELERRRAHVAAMLAQTSAQTSGVSVGVSVGVDSDPNSNAPLTVTQVAQHIGGVTGKRLLKLADRLRELIGSVLSVNEVCRRASEMLSTHMEGLMKQVSAELNHAGTYGRRGAVDPGPRVVSALDVKS